MTFAGIDLGSRATKVVVIAEDGTILERREADTTFDALPQAGRFIADLPFDRIQATGYGRHLFASAHGVPVVSEILAYAAGAFELAV